MESKGKVHKSQISQKSIHIRKWHKPVICRCKIYFYSNHWWKMPHLLNEWNLKKPKVTFCDRKTGLGHSLMYIIQIKCYSLISSEPNSVLLWGGYIISTLWYSSSFLNPIRIAIDCWNWFNLICSCTLRANALNIWGFKECHNPLSFDSFYS